jgi:GGDEF domain-containing protein
MPPVASTPMNDEADLRRQVDELRDELESLKLTLDVVGTMDLDSGILNRTGILDALERGQRWLSRRGDIYGLLVVHFPDLDERVLEGADATEFRTHVAATIGAAVREVDSVGRVDEDTFGAVLADLNPGAIEIVAGRMSDLLTRLAETTPAMGGRFRLGGLEVLSAQPSGSVLAAAIDLALGAGERPALGQLE